MPVLDSIINTYDLHKCYIMKYRSKIDIFASILELAAEDGVRLTKLMYLTFTSYVQLKQFLKLLTDNSMLEYDSHRRFYRTTKKGFQFLELYRQIGELVKIDSMNLNVG